MTKRRKSARTQSVSIPGDPRGVLGRHMRKRVRIDIRRRGYVGNRLVIDQTATFMDGQLKKKKQQLRHGVSLDAALRCLGASFSGSARLLGSSEVEHDDVQDLDDSEE
jgi:hypothetical protein